MSEQSPTVFIKLDYCSTSADRVVSLCSRYFSVPPFFSIFQGLQVITVLIKGHLLLPEIPQETRIGPWQRRFIFISTLLYLCPSSCVYRRKAMSKPSPCTSSKIENIEIIHSNTETDDDDEWELVGRGSKDGPQTYYKRAKVTRTDGRIEFYSIGESVWLEAEDFEIWVGIIISFYDDPEDEHKQPQRVVIRWLYSKHHLDDSCTIETVVRRPFHIDELFFADHIDKGTNPLSTISGRAHLFQTRKEHNEAQLQKGERRFLVRNFYTPSPSRLRALEPGELKFLLKHADFKPMSERFKNAGGARNDYMGKGTGGNRSFKATSTISKKNPRKKREAKKELLNYIANLTSSDEELEKGPRLKRVMDRKFRNRR